MRFYDSLIIQKPFVDHSFCAQDFDLGYWRRQQDSTALAGGRGASQKITIEHEYYVLRHYLRGGLVAHVLKDQYLWTGLQRCRAFQENRIIEHAPQLRLPVPEVIAYRIAKTGFYYRASIISRYIENQGSLADKLFDARLEPLLWFELGVLIRRLHRAGIYHADLNANNILLGVNNDFYLIDFDKAKLMRADSNQGEKNVQRLLRSLRKIESQQIQRGRAFHFKESDWQQLLAGYAAKQR